MEERFNEKSTLKLLLKFSIGPVIIELSSCLAGALRNYWINKAFGKHGLSWVGCVFVPRCIIHGFSQMIYVSTTTTLGYLYGNKKGNMIQIVLFDLFRICVIFSVVIPVLIIILAFILAEVMNTNTKSRENGIFYLTPLCFGFIFTSCFALFRGVLQGNGLSIMNGVFHLCSFFLSVCVLEPLFLMFLKTGIYGVSLSMVLSEGIVCIVTAYFLMKKEYIKISNNVSWFSEFSNETISGLGAGFSSLFIQISAVIPCLIIQKYLTLSSKLIGEYVEVMGSWNVMCNVYDIITSVVYAVMHGLLPTGSFMFGSKNGKQLLFLTFQAFCISLVWSLTVCLCFIIYPNKFLKIWMSDSKFNEILKKMINPSVYTGYLCSFRVTICTLFQIIKHGKFAIVINLISQLFGLPLFSTLLYFRDKKNPTGIVWCYTFSDILGMFFSILFSYIPFNIIRKII